MKTSWQTPLAIAAIVLSAFVALSQMNRVSADDAQRIEARLTALEKQQDQQAKWNERADAKFSRRFTFISETVRRLDYMCDRDKECRGRFGPMVMPE